MRWSRARAIADAVLFEGYSLYPYRASSRKNQFRWPFGFLAPTAWARAGGCERSWMETQCLADIGVGATLDMELRFLQAERRTVEEHLASGDYRRVPSLDVDGHLFVSWDEGNLQERDVSGIAIEGPCCEQAWTFDVAGREISEELRSGEGVLHGRIGKRSVALRIRLHLRVDQMGAPGSLVKLTFRIENVTPCDDVLAQRDDVIPSSCLGTHLMLAVSGGAFVSLLDPPERAKEAASRCTSLGLHPVLAGPPGSSDLVLAAPIILYDHPQIAPESTGDFFDATEIDEILALRTSLLTPEEKREARATDARAGAVVDHADGLLPAARARLHGAIRDVAGGAEMRPRGTAGARVRLAPGRRRTDAQDLLFAGHIATIEKVMTDVEGQTVFAVTIDSDPAADLHRWYGRYHYYYPDEIEWLASPETEAQ